MQRIESDCFPEKDSMKLRKNEMCPIHKRRTCCGRTPTATDKKRGSIYQVAPGVRRIPDSTHPRGYRELRSPAARRGMLNQKIVAQNRLCGICGEPFETYQEIELDHIEPKGMGSARRDDSWENTQATHKFCNREKGSRRL